MDRISDIEIKIRDDIERLKNTIKDNTITLDNYVQVIFLLLLFLVDCHHSKEEHNKASHQLISYFKEAKKEYSENAEFLFFLGYFIPIAEWYFGVDDVSLAYQMREQAMLKSPGNILYEWAYYFSDPNNEQAGILSKKLLTQPDLGLNWLEEKGMPGRYIIGMIEKCSRDWELRHHAV